ncbi:MAG: aminopeptidase P family protein [Candidatus Nitrosopumilus limneticus]|nr:Xaa-Pro aminopeptidase [Candidatus Nitrosopumilus limneticus]MDC4212054.1 aminopeptidase P family protein [Candidatus Nitrosopumilus limneticus]MDC4214497.1 aminopeptidase P family protein [Candidatus Nitrosopumilus limneticus]MDC4216131.1 aminopeptidase P family protein [Candidatus Nitrosopumilus limneticus]MDC4219719.1 aminopeptidase P family protein [Candidatus Nitrosopumilus limneticus]
MKERRKNLLKYAQKMDCDTLVTFEPENLFYMTGFWGEAIGLLEKNGKTTIIAPELEVGRAKNESEDCDVITAERGSGLIFTLINKIKKNHVCTDCKDYSTMLSLKKSISHITSSTDPFYNARIIKDEKEIKILKKASKIIDEMFDICSKKVKVGQKESELQTVLMTYAMQQEMFDTGYKSTLNPLIIAGGPNGALPHAQVSQRKFKKGDLIVTDLTLRYKGYVSDATRTFALGKISSQANEAYEIVKESQKLGLKSVKPNVNCKDVDYACRKYIEEKNYGKYFIHSTGHGIGLEVHELPTISYRSDTKLKENMAITVEPGIYIENKFGIRIEDSLIVKNKPIIMHKFTKDLLQI